MSDAMPSEVKQTMIDFENRFSGKPNTAMQKPEVLFDALFYVVGMKPPQVTKTGSLFVKAKVNLIDPVSGHPQPTTKMMIFSAERLPNESLSGKFIRFYLVRREGDYKFIANAKNRYAISEEISSDTLLSDDEYV